MTATAEQIKTILSELPQRDRAELAHFLLHTLDDDEQDSGSSPGASGAGECLDDQLNRRLQETLAGLPVNEPVEDALAELRRLLP